MDQQATRNVDRLHVLKWSSRQVDKAARVRDNQRRHREKVRNYIAQLESRLAESQNKLQQAEVTIKLLTEKLGMPVAAIDGMTQREKAPNTCAKIHDTTSQNSPSPPAPPTSATAMHRRTHSTYVDGTDVCQTPCYANEQECSQSAWPGWADTATAKERAKERESYDQALLMGRRTPLLASSSMMEPLKYDANAEIEKYSEMLPPGTNESTSRCRDAYAIIAEQNFAGLEVSTICSWLQPGFRRPAATQNGCRVDNQLLFALLDHISSSEVAVSFTV